MILGSCSISYASILVRKVNRFPISQDRREQTVRLRIKRQVTKKIGVSSWFKAIFLLYGLRKSPLERAQCVRDPCRTCELLPSGSFYLLLTVVPMKPHDSWFQKLQPIKRLHHSESILERECHPPSHDLCHGCPASPFAGWSDRRSRRPPAVATENRCRWGSPRDLPKTPPGHRGTDVTAKFGEDGGAEGRKIRGWGGLTWLNMV